MLPCSKILHQYFSQAYTQSEVDKRKFYWYTIEIVHCTVTKNFLLSCFSKVANVDTYSVSQNEILFLASGSVGYCPH